MKELTGLLLALLVIIIGYELYIETFEGKKGFKFTKEKKNAN